MTAHADSPLKIAFVDTGNTGRSVSAEALSGVIAAKQGLRAAFISRAVDMDPFDVHPEANAVTLLHGRGLDVTGHIAAQIAANDARHADVILTMTNEHKTKVLELFPDASGKTYTLAEYATGTHTDVPDAYGKPMDVYQAMFSQLDAYLPAALEKASRRK